MARRSTAFLSLALLSASGTASAQEYSGEHRFREMGFDERGPVFVDRSTIVRRGDDVTVSFMTVYLPGPKAAPRFLYERQTWRANCRTYAYELYGPRDVFDVQGRLFGTDATKDVRGVSSPGTLFHALTFGACQNLAERHDVFAADRVRTYDSPNEFSLAVSVRSERAASSTNR